MITERVKYDAMTCIISEDPTLELLPEPFRMQGGISFCVPYNEYKRYILTLEDDCDAKLMTDVKILQRLAEQSSPILFRCFLKDMAYAICKEIFYASTRDKEASVIIPVADDATVLYASNLVNLYSFAKEHESDLQRVMRQTGYELPDGLSEHNSELYKLAVVLYHLSYQSTMNGFISLVYDLT